MDPLLGTTDAFPLYKSKYLTHFWRGMRQYEVIHYARSPVTQWRIKYPCPVTQPEKANPSK